MSLLSELRRRNVLRAGAAYLAGSWLLVQVADIVLPRYGFGDGLFTGLITVLAIGFPLALVLAWVYEWTPQGLKRDMAATVSGSSARQLNRNVDRIIIFALVLALGFFAVDKFVLDPVRDMEVAESARQEGRSQALVEGYGDKSIAVLAFEDMSPDGDQHYLSDGLSESLLNLLAKVPELRVISRASAFSFKGKDTPIPKIAEQLNVAHVLEGSVRYFEGRVRISAQLIDARADTHLWSETYDRPFGDIFAIQDDISARVVKELKLKLIGPQKSWDAEKELDLEAYRIFLEIEDYDKRTAFGEEKVQTLIGKLQALLEMAPDFAPAWAALGEMYERQFFNSLQNAFSSEVNAQALAHRALDRALQLDPGLVKAHLAKSGLARAESRLHEAARHLQLAVDIDPLNTNTLAAVSKFLTELGRVQQVPVIHAYLEARDPVNAFLFLNIGLENGYARRIEGFESAFLKSLALDPEGWNARVYWATGLAFTGRYHEAIEILTGLGLNLVTIPPLAFAYQQSGMNAELQGLLESVSAESPEPRLLARLHASLGHADLAFEWLHQWWLQSGGSQVWLQERWYPFYWPIEDDPRWPAFLEEVGVSDAQLAEIEFELTMPPVN